MKFEFSESNINRLSEVTILLKNILEANNCFGYHIAIDNVLDAAKKKNDSEFISFATHKTLFGGMGALWEIYFAEESLMKKFETTFLIYLEILNEIGLNNERVNQIRQGFIKKSQ
ncbi:MAG: hypothetical protein RJA07_1096 [Bacteroidota bacterium]|jgi:hypothetical protein